MASMKCPNCGALYPWGTKNCTEVGCDGWVTDPATATGTLVPPSRSIPRHQPTWPADSNLQRE